MNDATARKGLSSQKLLSRSRQDAKTAYAMLVPTFILLTLFALLPLGMSLFKSFTDFSFYKTPEFIGFHNYRIVLADPFFRKAVLVAFKLVFLIVPVQFVAAFLFAHLIKEMSTRIGAFVKTTIYIPLVISGIVVGAVFSFIYNYQGGILNSLLNVFGIENQAWIADSTYALYSVAAPAIWQGFGYVTLMMLAGLLDIPKDYYEAAKMDGASAFRRMVYITIPNMKNVFIFIFISGVTGALSLYEIVLMITNGGPGGETLTPVLHLVNHFNNDPTMGYTVAGAIIMAIILGSFSAVIFRIVQSDKAID
ncbi:carbohydrate ABC transporter permease [Paenibacillus paeoniae]|uniref:carbohydrate ABC transporter permease n=1 Tax=Paenibacillus paeoniae TaxID=2292705 RepID=UPI001403D0B7|nr:sugar ABC transporter permease [Paenibacillus paeoniae]